MKTLTDKDMAGIYLQATLELAAELAREGKMAEALQYVNAHADRVAELAADEARRDPTINNTVDAERDHFNKGREAA